MKDWKLKIKLFDDCDFEGNETFDVEVKTLELQDHDYNSYLITTRNILTVTVAIIDDDEHSE